MPPREVEPCLTPRKKHVRLSSQLVRVESVKRYKEVFSWLDIDGDGEVTADEISTRTRNPRGNIDGEFMTSDDVEVVRTLFKSIAKGGKRDVTYDKPTTSTFTFHQMLRQIYPRTTKKEITKLVDLSLPAPKETVDNSAVEEMMGWFSTFDKDGSGQISKQEFVHALEGAFDMDEVEEMFDHADRDATGWIDIKEFLMWFESGCRSKHKTPKKSYNNRKSMGFVDKENANPQMRALR